MYISDVMPAAACAPFFLRVFGRQAPVWNGLSDEGSKPSQVKSSQARRDTVGQAGGLLLFLSSGGGCDDLAAVLLRAACSPAPLWWTVYSGTTHLVLAHAGSVLVRSVAPAGRSLGQGRTRAWRYLRWGCIFSPILKVVELL